MVIVSPTRISMPTGQRSEQIQMPGKVIPHPRRRSFSHGLLMLLMLLLLLMMNEERSLLLLRSRHRHSRLHHHFRRGGGGSSKAPYLSKIRPSRKSPQTSRSSRANKRVSNRVILGGGGGIIVGAYTLPENERSRSRSKQGFVVKRRRRERGVVGGAAERDRDGGEAGGGGAGAGGGDDGGLSLTEEPLDGLAIGLVAELARELEDAGGADDWHPYTAAAAVDFAVTVLGGRFLD